MSRRAVSVPRAHALALLLAIVACGDHRSDAQGGAAHAILGGDIAARVGDVDIPVTAVEGVAAERRVVATVALALLVDDAVAAKAALARGLDHTASVRLATSTVQARATIERVKAEARARLPSDDEVRTLSAEHWIEVDRPETLVVIHAVVVRPKKADPGAEAAGKAVAAAIATAEVGALDADDFESRAKAVPSGGAEVKVERLDTFAADGRVAVPGPPSSYDPRFAAGAAALVAPGATSGVVESAFGWHVLRLLERRPASVVPIEDRRRMFAEEAFATRSSEALDRIEASMKAKESVTYENGLDALLAQALPAMKAQDSAPAAPPAQ